MIIDHDKCHGKFDQLALKVLPYHAMENISPLIDAMVKSSSRSIGKDPQHKLTLNCPRWTI
jgi:hypothetical protein